MSEYVVAKVETKEVGTDEMCEAPYYKVFLKDPSGSLWYETEFDDLESAENYVKVSEKYPDMGIVERSIKAEKGEQ